MLDAHDLSQIGVSLRRALTEVGLDARVRSNLDQHSVHLAAIDTKLARIASDLDRLEGMVERALGALGAPMPARQNGQAPLPPPLEDRLDHTRR